MELEKLVKSSFEKFEPEVDPSVWQHLEQNLGSPSAPSDPSGAASIVGKTVVSSVISKVSPWIWAGGLVTLVAIIATIVITSSKKNTDISSPKLPEAQAAFVESDQIKKEGMIASVSTTSSADSKKGASESILKSTHQEKPTAKSEKEQNSQETTAQNSNKSITTNTVNAPESNTSTVVPDVAEKNSSENQEENKGTKSNSERVKTQPIIILNTQIGFAPLKVVALLNDENLKGNWDFNDGQDITSGTSATHILSKPGTYTLSCVIGDKKIEKIIEVIGSISTAFTPNGDGMNEEFFIESNQLQELNVKIVDRSGRKVFEITQPGQRWDGNDLEGKNMLSGTYFYNIFARSYNGQPINQKGTINIFR